MAFRLASRSRQGGAGQDDASETMTPRRFPPPWIVIEHAESFGVQDAGGQTAEAKVLTRDEARGRR